MTVIVADMLIGAVSWFTLDNDYAVAGLLIGCAMYVHDQYLSNPFLIVGITSLGEA